MNLRKRTLLILGVVSLLIFSVSVVTTLTIGIGGLNGLETRSVEKGISQVRYAVENEESLLEGTIQDYAWWDDTYQYVRGENPEFIVKNINPDGMSNLNVHLVAVINRSGSVVYSGRFSPLDWGESRAPPDVFRMIESNPEILQLSAAESRSGLLILPDGPMAVAYAPILPSDESGEPAGFLIMGRYLNYGQLTRISHIIGYPVAISWAGEENLSKERTSLLAGPDTEEPVIRVHPSEDEVSGYTRLTDLNGRSILLEVDIPREVFNQGMGTLILTLGFFVIFSVATLLIMIFILDSLVLRRLLSLRDQVNSLGSTSRILLPVLSGNDELTDLEQVILSKHHDLSTSEDRLRAFIDALRDPAMLLSSDGTILLANEAVAGKAGISVESIIGKKLADLPPGVRILNQMHLDAVVESKKSVQFDEKLNGSNYLVSAYPIFDGEGRVTQIAIHTIDTTENKRMETALSRATKKISILDSYILNEIQNQIFVLQGYLNLIEGGQQAYLNLMDGWQHKARLSKYLKAGEEASRKIQQQLKFAQQYREMGTSLPKWQRVPQVMLFALSHIDTENVSKDFALEGLEIYADAMLESAFVAIFENAILDRAPIHVLRGTYRLDRDQLVLYIEDDGKGVPHAGKEKIFGKPLETNKGLGLFLTREILSLTDITIKETGEPGKGGRFEISVPKGAYRFIAGAPDDASFPVPGL